MDNRAIGIFDSGAGGLTALRCVREIMPNEDIVYFGDTVNVPYGEKSREDVIKCGRHNIEFLKSKNVKVILAACGTVSSQLGYIKSDIPVLGIIEPVCKKAAMNTKNGKIGVLATSATIKSGIYKKTCTKISPELEIYEQPCPRLATLIENGHISTDDVELLRALSEYLEKINSLDVDTLILGCTHYPIVENAIRNLLVNKNIIILDAGREAAIVLKRFVFESNLRSENTSKSENIKYFISGKKAVFSKVAHTFLGYSIEDLILPEK
ncbi:MAG: glutamate racemase [Clostridia bacterium]|nr:glutamate racemase [Clostridia bacterium]